MHKLSPLNIHINDAPIVITIEEVNLGNTSNEATLYRTHQFTVIRPDLMGMAGVTKKINDREKNIKSGFTGKLKNIVTNSKPVINLKAFVELKLIPEFVLINPSDWGGLSTKDKTGSVTDIPITQDALVSLHKYIGYTGDATASINFKIKGSNV